jgi:hypothetical protein
MVRPVIRRALLVSAALVLPLIAMTPAAAAGSRPCTLADPRLSEVSGIAARAGDSWVSTEGWDQPIIPVPVPRAVLLAPTTTPSHSSPSPSSSPAPGHGSSGSGIGWGLIAIVAAAVLAFILGSRLRRRGRHKDQGGDDLSWTG